MPSTVYEVHVDGFKHLVTSDEEEAKKEKQKYEKENCTVEVKERKVLLG